MSDKVEILADPVEELIAAAKAVQQAEDDCEACSDFSYMAANVRTLRRAERRLKCARNAVVARDFSPDSPKEPE